MKELKAKPKMTQAMTRDGLTLENQATVHFTELSGRHSVLERPLSEVNGRPFFS